jgi:hypothetical protein
MTCQMKTASQRALVAALRASASRCVAAHGGGFWSIDGVRVDTSSATVYALSRRGVLLRTNANPQYYRDTYRLNEEPTP